MKFRSIKTKLSVAVGICSIVIIFALVAYTSIETRKDAITVAKEHGKGVAGDYAGHIKAELEVAMDTARTLAQVFSAVKDEQSPLDIGRDPVNAILRTVLLENDSFLAICSEWEPDAFDGMDSSYANLQGHDETGRFMSSWTRDENGAPVFERCSEHKIDKIDDEYALVKRTGIEAVIEPQTFSGHGRKDLATSLVAPIMHGDKFYGTVCVDIQLKTMQEMVDRANLYDGQGQISIISNGGKLVAVSGRPELIGKGLKELHRDWQEDIVYVREGREILESDEGRFAVFHPIHIGRTQTPWCVNINIPHSVITADATVQTWLTIIIGGCLAGLSLLLIYLVIGRIIRPLGGLTKIAKNVAQGDLEYDEIETANDEIGHVNAVFGEVVESFREITSVCEGVVLGDFSKTVNVRGDRDTLGRSINRMSETLRGIVRQANSIAEGDYSTEVVPRSEADELGIALSNMTTRLRETTGENERRSWLIKGQAELNDTMRGQQETVELAQKIITKVTEHLGAQIGAIYLTESDDTLKMVGSYAHTRRKSVANGFKFGEGLAGQAALERKSILVTGVPDDYVPIGSGLGQAVARNIVVLPFMHEGIVMGVIEVGSFGEFTDTQLEFLENAKENIAIAVNSAQARARMARLLEETQRQSEELESQQEELRATNEELEQQRDRLEESEDILKAKQQDLECANADLETKTVELEEQKHELEESWNQVKAKSQELELANKYKSEFLSNMSHELRTPLNSMLILAKMFCDNEQGNLTDEQVDSAKVIHDGGNELLSLINEILDLSKIEAGKVDIHIKQVKMSALADDIEKSFKHIAQEKGVYLKINISQDLPVSIRTDGKRVRQVIKNFLSNAFKFTEKGEVSVDMGRPDAGVDLAKSGLRPGGAVAISVSDTGIGIAKDKQEIIMEAFRQADGTTSRTYGGTGLGLSISRELANLLGGEVQLQSEPGKGSTFTLYLPEKMQEPVGPEDVSQAEQVVERNASVDDNRSRQQDGPAQQVTIGKEITPDDRNNIGDHDKVMLIVEDDAKFAKILVEMSHDRDFKCLVAGDGKTGLKFAVEHEPLAIILDVGLPGMDGIAVLEALKDDPKTRHIPVHFISAADKELDAMKMGAVDYLTKPVSPEALDQVYDKLNKMISKSVSSQSTSLGSGGSSQPLAF